METSSGTQVMEATGPEGAERLLGRILPVYETVFAEPPYGEGPRDVADFLERFDRERRTPGFRITAADQDGLNVGFTYGYELQSETSWWEGFVDTKPAEAFTREDGHRTFVIMELAVLPAQRRHGLATQMHAKLLDGLQTERVTLAVRPEAEPALTLYKNLGYSLVGHSRPWDDSPLYQVLIRPLGA
ncbi:GNAT family N-acetyltransferase [Streptomyces sp. NPDC002730]|uniref:GNAT family N-acetyltransferase n=1 Tax=Streptomyces sp. NPDC002730 TaxID=3364662 RepID=UPI0036974C7A